MGLKPSPQQPRFADASSAIDDQQAALLRRFIQLPQFCFPVDEIESHAGQGTSGNNACQTLCLTSIIPASRDRGPRICQNSRMSGDMSGDRSCNHILSYPTPANVHPCPKTDSQVDVRPTYRILSLSRCRSESARPLWAVSWGLPVRTRRQAFNGRASLRIRTVRSAREKSGASELELNSNFLSL